MIRRPGSIRRVRDLGCPPVRGESSRLQRFDAVSNVPALLPPDRAQSGDSPPAGGSGVDPANREAVILQRSRRPLRSTPWTTRPSGGAIRSLNSRDAFDRATVPRRSRHGESGQWRLASAMAGKAASRLLIRSMRAVDALPLRKPAGSSWDGVFGEKSTPSRLRFGKTPPVVYSLRVTMRRRRAVAQFGSALDWGSRGRGFKSRQPD